MIYCFCKSKKQICCCSHTWIQYWLCFIVFSLQHIRIFLHYLISFRNYMCILSGFCIVYLPTSMIGTCTIRSDAHNGTRFWVCTVHPGSVVPSPRCWRNVWCCAPLTADRVLLGAKNLLLKYTLCSLAHYVGIQKVLESRICRPVWPNKRGYVIWVIA